MNDLISRQQAIEAVEKSMYENPHENAILRGMHDHEHNHFLTILMGLPSAQPEPEAVSKWKKEFREYVDSLAITRDDWKVIIEYIDELPPIQPERKTGHWILDRSGRYCCNRCMEPCATYMMMKPRDKYCKMCGSRNEVME